MVRWSATAVAQVAQALPSLSGLQRAWPATGLGPEALRQAAQLLSALIPQAPGATPPFRPVAVQAWSPEFLAHWRAEHNGGAQAGATLLAGASQQWQVRTPAGVHPLFARLLLPGGRLPGQAEGPGTRGSPGSGAPSVRHVHWPDAGLLSTGALAWVFESETQGPFNALMLLDWGPRRDPLVYGRAPAFTRDDPWILQAQWLALGLREREGKGQHALLCDTTDCPYRGRSVCPQPFCPATGVVAGVSAV